MDESCLDPDAIDRTGKLMCRAREILAYGHIDLIVPRPLYLSDGGVYPYFAREAKGCRLFDSTGQSYIDWVNGWGPVLLGYRRPEVEEAIRSQLSAGPNLSLMHPLEVEVAAVLTEIFPCAEMVAFGKNGSDGLTAAVRVARCATNRERILQFGMHGFHDWYTCVDPNVRGIPEFNRKLIHPFPYNDLDVLSGLFEIYSGEVAAVVMEPVREILPEPGYLERVRELTHAHGALLIYDEVVTSFRLANGGAQEFYNVIPDLACLGKGMANGMPLSALVGPKKYMQLLPAVNFGMTFRGETLSLAAARAVLKILREEPVAEHLARIGTEVRNGFEQACDRTGVDCRLNGPPARMTFQFQDAGGMDWYSLQSLFIRECLKRGIFINNNILPSFAHEDGDVRETVKVFGIALKVVAAAIREGRPVEGDAAGDPPYEPLALFVKGYIDCVREEGEGIRVGGWMLLDDLPPHSIEFVPADGIKVPAQKVKRPDLVEAFPVIPGVEDAGYTALLPAIEFAGTNGYDFWIHALRDDRTIFRCRVLIGKVGTESVSSGGPYWTGDGVVHI